MLFCICVPSFVVIGRLAAELWQHIDFSRWRPQSRKSTSGFTFCDGICLRRWKSICIPNFVEISQSMAELKLLPVSENGRLPYWNVTAGFDFDLRAVIGLSFCICMPNFVVIEPPSAELWRHVHFFILDLIWVMLDHPLSAIVVLSLVLKFGFDPIYSFSDIAIFIFWRFGLKLPIPAHFFWGGEFRAYFLQMWSPTVLTPKRHCLARKHVVWTIKRDNRSSDSTWAQDRGKSTGQDRTV